MISPPLDPRKFYFHSTPLNRPPDGEGWVLVDTVASVEGSILTTRVESDRSGNPTGGTHGSFGSSIMGIWAAPIESVVWVCRYCENEVPLTIEPTGTTADGNWAKDPRDVFLMCVGGTPKCMRHVSKGWEPEMTVRTGKAAQ